MRANPSCWRKSLVDIEEDDCVLHGTLRQWRVDCYCGGHGHGRSVWCMAVYLLQVSSIRSRLVKAAVWPRVATTR
jgi:hypothetical protein